MHPEPTLFDMDWQGVVLLRVLLLTHLWEGCSQAIANPLMTMGYPQIHPSSMGPPEGGVGAEDDGPCCHESSSQEGADPFGAESSQEDDEGLFIPSYLEEALPDDPVLQVKMAHAIHDQEVETRRCFTCNQQGHLQRDHWKYEEKMGFGPCS